MGYQMGWADQHIKDLQEGKTVRFRPHGRSMMPHVMSGQLVQVTPATDRELTVGMIVLCIVYGNQYLHFIKDISVSGTNFQIGNAHGRINGWISRSDIIGILDWKEELPSANGRPHGSQP